MRACVRAINIKNSTYLVPKQFRRVFVFEFDFVFRFKSKSVISLTWAGAGFWGPGPRNGVFRAHALARKRMQFAWEPPRSGNKQ